jgi:putative transposase
MGRPKRALISQESGSYHMISKVAGGALIFNRHDKEYFLSLLERLANGFFVDIHAFAIMSNHFHILVTCREHDARLAGKDELIMRYKLIFGKDKLPPAGRSNSYNEFIPDEDNGIERLRRRLGSISGFAKELKETFSRWYNKTYNRTGYLWGGRFKGIITQRGIGQLVCSAYIDTNPVRAHIVQIPEDYRWCSMGLQARSPVRAKKLLQPILVKPEENAWNQFPMYRHFVYLSGGIKQIGKAKIPPELVKHVASLHGKLGIEDRLRYRMRNLSEGIAFGSQTFIAQLQEQMKRKYICPRSFIDRKQYPDCDWSFTTRVLKR